MKQLDTQKGFTLVELAIVMTIIALLIGGVLKGQELMENARVTATVAQIKAIEAATTTFRDAYGAMPGDMPNGNQRLPGCSTAASGNRCNAFVWNGAGAAPTTGWAGDGVVGNITWTPAPGVAAAAWPTQLQTGASMATPDSSHEETYLFWQHLMLANLVSGVTDASVRTDTSFAWNVTHPAARLRGGFVVGSTRGSAPQGNTQTAGFITGTVLALVATPTDAFASNSADYALTPSRAAQLDLKIEEGRGGVGFVQGFGIAASAAGGTGCFLTGADSNYNESGTNRSCGLLFRIQG